MVKKLPVEFLLNLDFKWFFFFNWNIFTDYFSTGILSKDMTNPTHKAAHLAKIKSRLSLH